jgi:poly-gamma-glutamate synthesis protein (capsule biosynthesis protein)
MMGGRALTKILLEGADFPFDSTRSILSNADLTMGNLEAPFTDRGRPFPKKFTFRVPPLFVTGLLGAGFDLVTLANNHILDFGLQGLYDTITLLDSVGIGYCGAGQDKTQALAGRIIEREGWRVGFLAYSLTYPEAFWATKQRGGTAYPNMRAMKEEIEDLKMRSDLIVVSFHWGEELREDPKAYQRYYAQQVIDFGADLVVGHHPHILQGIEYYKERLIAYSLGNFVFGSYSQRARESIILRIYIDRKGLLFAEVVPISVYNFHVQFQPRQLDGDLKTRLINHMNKISQPLNNGDLIIQHSGLIRMSNTYR